MQGEKLMKSKFVVLLICIILGACDREAGNASTPTDTVALPDRPSAIAHTLTPAPTPTETLLPPLSVAQAEVRIIELLQNNGDCRLPCFWGFVTAETQKDKILSFLNSLDSIWQNGLIIPRNDSTIQILLNADLSGDPTTTVKSMTVYMSAFRVRESAEGIYHDNVYNNPSFPDYIQYYTLSELLSNYGPPALESGFLSVWDPWMPEGGRTFFLSTWTTRIQGGGSPSLCLWRKMRNSIWVCPSQAFTTLDLWSPEDTFTAQRLTRWMQDFLFLGIEEAMSMSVEEFYNQFKSPADTTCLETPKEVWP